MVSTHEENLRSALEQSELKVKALELLLEEKTRDLNVEHNKIEDANRKLMSVLQSMNTAVLVTNEHMEIELVNNTSEQILGVSLLDLFQQKLSDLLPIEELQNISEDVFYMIHGLEREILFENKTTGKKVPLLISISSFFFKQETAAGIVCQCTDLTKRKALEQSVFQAQKLESIGTLAAGIAHEINTPIQYIRDNTVFVRDEIPQLLNLLKEVKYCDGDMCTLESLQENITKLDYDFLTEQLPLALDQTIEGVSSVAKIVRSLKEFSHPGAQQKEPINLNSALEGTITISRNEWKYVSDVEFIPDNQLDVIPCYPGELNQAFLNIIVNAAHAVEQKIKNGEFQKGKIRVATQSLPDGALVIITDNGTGIPKHAQDKIFDPFFTTKEVGKGTGQGLALVHRFIIDRHGGTVSFETEEGIGTTFKIFIPRSVEQKERIV